MASSVELRPMNVLRCPLQVRLRDDSKREFLVQFNDGRDDEWVEESNMAPGGYTYRKWVLGRWE